MLPLRRRFWAILLLLVTAFALTASEADARAGRGFSSGSRGARTFSTPSVTRTAPNAAAPIQRTITQPGQSTIGRAATAPSGGFFGRPGLLGGLAAGFIGAGLFGLLFGHGLFGGLGGFASIFGLLLQIVLVVVIGRMIWAWFKRRNVPAYDTGPSGAPGYGRSDFIGMAPGSATPGVQGDVAIQKEDYDAFEQLLGEVQLAYGREDLNALRQHVTPEMLSYFADELADNASRGLVNQVSDVKLLQGDLSEAWREGAVDYATVAMTYSLIDRTVDRASGRLVDGDAANPVEVTELWTFRRSAGGGHWLLSAIQQA